MTHKGARAVARFSDKRTAAGSPRPAKDRAGPTSEAPDGRRAELIRAAYHIIAEKGLEGLRTRDIAGKVGINISTLHYHFDTKQALITSVVEHVAHLFRTLRAPLPPGATPLNELRHLFESQGYRRRIAPELEIVVQELMLRARRDGQVRAAFASVLSTWESVVEEIVARCNREGYLRGDNPDSKSVAAVVTSFLIGANMQLGIRPTSFSLKAAAKRLTIWLVGPVPRPRRNRR